MTLKDRIQDDMKEAMRAKDAARLGTIRMLMAAIKQREVDERITLDDANVLQVLNKMIKQRRESVSQYETGHRLDLVEKEQQEIAILQAYLPQQLSEAEVDTAVAAAIESVGATSIKDMGKVMAVLKEKLSGQADMAVVSAKIKQKLA